MRLVFVSFLFAGLAWGAGGYLAQPIEQGWSDKDRDHFWYTPQGSYVIPYFWFLALPDPEAKRPFREILPELGFISSVRKSVRNPDALPIGLTKEFEPTGAFPVLQNKGPWLGITCAACHSGAVTVNGKTHLIDGAPALIDFEGFSLKLEQAMERVSENDAAFESFATRVRKNYTPPTKEEFAAVYTRLRERNSRTFFDHGERKGAASVNAGPGRTDAFGAINNEVVSRALGVKANAKVASAPVSYPHIWGGPFLQWVQYNGLTNNAFTRNIGEVLGVFGDVILDPTSPAFLDSTVRFIELAQIEDELRTLKAPKWEQIVGAFTPKEVEMQKRGKTIFENKCSQCHALTDERTVTSKLGGKFEPVETVWANEFQADFTRNTYDGSGGTAVYVGTDLQYFMNLKTNWSEVETGPFQGSTVFKAAVSKYPSFIANLRFEGDSVDAGGKLVRGKLATELVGSLASTPNYGAKDNAIRLLATTTLALALKQFSEKGVAVGTGEEYMYLSGGADFEKQEKIGAYKARNLAGIAFTGPYFHNGSVRTLRQVLTPPSQRDKAFQIGSSEFDEKDVGYVSKGPYRFRANKMGNLAIGHPFGTDPNDPELKDGGTEALLQYLKSL